MSNLNVEQCILMCPDSRVDNLVVCGPSDDTSVMPSMRGGSYEPSIQRLFCGMVKKGMTVCDVGANFGQHTALLSKLVGPGGKVYAVEASPENVEYIKATIEANGLDNVEIINTGVWSSNTELTFSHVDGAGATSFCSNKKDIKTIESNPACKYRTINVSTLDDLISIDIDFMKMDIEGSELFALRGAQRFLSSGNPVLVELNKYTYKTFMGVEIDDVINHMFDNGYDHLYTWSMYQWLEVTQDMLHRMFLSGAIIVDVLFTTSPCVLGSFDYVYGSGKESK